MPQETAPACQGLSLALPLPSFVEKHGYKIESSDSESAPVFSVSNPVVVHPPATVPLVMAPLPSVPEGPALVGSYNCTQIVELAKTLLCGFRLHSSYYPDQNLSIFFHYWDQETCWQLYWLYQNTLFQALQECLAGGDHTMEYLAGFVQPSVKQLQLVAVRHNLELLSLEDTPPPPRPEARQHSHHGPGHDCPRQRSGAAWLTASSV
ncbi:hypothetical protein DSO57_1013070 [Entomophthora muscae]|uniref:Uncharacterized protein n=1 Tax=Entomophthora muscae TaxID=34485 RepID=A0ACC2SIX7_9FUNG|nr:hypothetical protein DSO57_1013070 [Entomophthora muscae]